MPSQIFRPTSDFEVQWTPSTGVENYAMVDEAVADDGDYVSAVEIGFEDFYGMTTPSIPAGATNITVTIHFRGKRLGGYTGYQSIWALAANSSEGDVWYTNILGQTVTEDFEDYEQASTTNEITGNPYTPAEINSGLILDIVSFCLNGTAYVSQAWAEISYDLADEGEVELEGSQRFRGAVVANWVRGSRAVTGTISKWVGTLGRIFRTTRSLTGSLPTFSGILTTLSLLVGKFAGSLPTFVGDLVRVVKNNRTLSGALSFAGTIAYSIVGSSSKLITGALRFAGALSVSIQLRKSASGSLRMSGRLYILQESFYYGSPNP